MVSKRLKRMFTETFSNTAQLYGIVGTIAAGAAPIPIPKKYPPSFVITWDKKRKMPKFMSGREYLKRNG